MTTLKNLKGTAIQFLDADPVVYAGAWSSGGNMNTAREVQSGAGTQTSAIAAGGNSPANGNFGIVEEYNGSAWSEVADLNSARNIAGGFGANAEATISYGGRDPGATRGYTESWNGSAWTEVNDMNQARFAFAGPGVGTSTSGMAVAGSPGDTLVETWDGTNWTEVAEINTRRTQGGAAGAANTAAIAFGGYDDGASANTANAEVWNGSAWTEVNNLNTARSSNTGSGTSTATLCIGGRNPGGLAKTESWNGTSWTEVADLAQARYDGASANSSPNTTSIMFGGKNPPSTYFALTEEWSFPSGSIVQEGDMWFNSSSSTLKGYGTAAGIPAGTWASGASLNTAREILAGWGTDNNAAGVAGGSPSTAATELYNGTAWTEVNNLNQARASVAGAGLYSAGIAVGAQPNTYYDKVELWDGTNWTETTEINTGRGYASLSGVQTACILIGGYSSPPTQRYAICEQWDGSSWTEIADLNTGRPGTGTAAGAPVTDTIAFGGYLSSTSPTKQNLVEKWNGTSWTEVAEMNTKRNVTSGHGDSGSNAGAFGGEQDSSTTNAEIWNGSSWTELANSANAGWRQLGGVPSLTKGILSGGSPPNNAYTEEWNAPALLVTVTTS